MLLTLIILHVFNLSFIKSVYFQEKSQRLGDWFAKPIVWVQIPPFPLKLQGKWLSGQKQWTVNPPNYFYIGSNPIFPNKKINKRKQLKGQALVCQTKSCGFDSRFPRILTIIGRNSSMVEYWNHNPRVRGSSPLFVIF